MRSSHNLARIETRFDEDNLVPNAGLLAPAALAQKLGVAELVDAHVKLPVDAVGRASCGTKAMTVIGAMLAGGDSIDDVEVLRAGAAPARRTSTSSIESPPASIAPITVIALVPQLARPTASTGSFTWASTSSATP